MNQKLFIALACAAALVPATSRAEDTNHWHFDSSLNLFLAGMSGDVAAKGLPASADASFKDIFEHLDAAAAGRFTLGYDRWFVSTEFSYLRLVAEPSVAKIEMEQWLVEPSVGYEFNEYLQAFAGARYNNIKGDIRFNGPLGHVTTGTQEWWDPIVGANVSLPLVKDKLSFDGHFDIGGFGAGSDFTWQAYPYLNWRISKTMSAQLGYRWLGTDYEDGSGASRFKYDVVLQGVQLGLTLHL
jgi:hypothetical protein